MFLSCRFQNFVHMSLPVKIFKDYPYLYLLIYYKHILSTYLYINMHICIFISYIHAHMYILCVMKYAVSFEFHESEFGKIKFYFLHFT